MLFFGVVGYVMKKYDYEPAPLILAFVLGPMFEHSFRQSLIMSNGSLLIFLVRPIAATFLLIAFALLFSPLALKALGRERPGLVMQE